ncbi:MAG: hypothetical protein IJF33_00405, partial [Clostridia bacterium]|nr:hypothetical protein [Clostridia bacterium]
MNPNNVIGIDFGNWNAYVCIAMGMDPTTRMGGHMEDLIPDNFRQFGSVGIPNEFFWNSKGEQLGFFAAREENRPADNHLRLLKKHLGETVTLYSDAAKTKSQTFRYDDIIVNMFEYHVGLEKETLRTNHGEAQTTNRISLCFPAKLRDPSALGYFVSLAERANSGATDEHGRPLKIKVVGTVCEP